MFARLGAWCHDHRRLVVLAWIVGLLAVGGVLGAVGTQSRTQFTLPDVESRRGFDLLEERFGGIGTGNSGSIVFAAEAGAQAPAVRDAMIPFLERVAAIEGITRVVSPYDPGPEAAQQISSAPGREGRIAFARLELDPDTSLEDAQTIVRQIEEAEPEVAGLQIELGGEVFAEFEPPSSEAIGLGFAVVILVLAFGSVLAMGLPVGVALAGIATGTILVGLLSNVLTIPDFATSLGVMIGLGVGIDYALFIVTRYREQLHAGHDVRDAIRVSIDTAGRAVTFAGTTVVISLLGMLVMQIGFVAGLAIAAAVVVAMTMLASVTLLPALLGFAGGRVELTRWRGLVAAGLVSLALVGVGLGIQPMLIGVPLAAVVLAASFAVAPLRRPVPRPAPKPAEQTAPYRWSRWVQRHPWPAALGGAAALVVLTLPVLGLRLGFSDEGNFPEDTTTRRAYDLLAEGFGPGFNGPLLLVTELGDGADPAALGAVSAALASTDGVAIASPAVPNDPAAPSAALWRVIPASAPQDEATTDLVERLRDEVLPPVEAAAGTDVLVTGSVAVNVDFSDYLSARLPIFFGAVLTLSFLLLMAVFRSVLVPLKAVVMNLLSIGAAFGIVVAVFQWGWGASLLGLGKAPVEPFLPMMLFAIVFGLSMDYEVFLLSRIKEAWHRTGDSHGSVADGLALTARVITAAAAIMVFVFGSFLLESERVIKLFGVGLATAVLIDATVVRMLLVPATMELLGDRNWWLPRWIDRLLPDIDVEGHADPVAPDEPSPELQPVG